MKNRRLFLFPALLFPAMLLAGVLAHAIGTTDGGQESASNPRDFNRYYAPAYRIPNRSTMPLAAARGKELIRSTYKYLGDQSVHRAANGRPYVGNKLACTNCHMEDGTQPNASPFVVVAKKYAAPGLFNARSNIFLDPEARVNTCFERSLAGEALPRDSQWMTDIVAYFNFLATGIQPGYTFREVAGQEFPSVTALTRAADPERGRRIFKNRCAECHENNGQGEWLDDQERFLFPAVWGDDSFGLMSGMGRLATAATMVWGTMPRNQVNIMDPTTRMPQADAWDVAAYLLSNDHPFGQRFVFDWTGVGPDGMPNWLRKPASASYDFTMPRVDADGSATDDSAKPPMFTREQHTFGPFQPIEEALRRARNLRGFQ